MNTIEILTVILLISSTILCIALIYYINKISKSVQSISENFKEALYKLEPLIDSSFILSEKLLRISDEVESQLQFSKKIIYDIKERIDILLNIETKIRSRIENTIMPAAKKISAVKKGFEAFWKSYNK